VKQTIYIPTIQATLPTYDIGVVCRDCASAWIKTFEGRGNIVFILTDEVLKCGECEGQALTAELSEDDPGLAGGFSDGLGWESFPDEDNF